MQVNRRLINSISMGTIALMMSCTFTASADFSNSNLRQPINEWSGMDGQIGKIYVHGTLTESTCRLAMDSAYQAINLGNISTAELQKVGDTGPAVSLDINLLDCVRHDTSMENFDTGTTTWSYIQPAVKVRFLATTINDSTSVIKVLGAKGLGIQISNSAGDVIPVGMSTPPQLLALNNDSLKYYITPVRTAQSLEAGQYYAVINFELIYD